MDIRITVDADNPTPKAIALKSFLEKEKIDGVESLEIEQAEVRSGDQGAATFLGSLFAKLTGSGEAIKGIVKVISRFIEQLDGRLIMEDGKGRKLVIPGGKKLTNQQKTEIALHFSGHK